MASVKTKGKRVAESKKRIQWYPKLPATDGKAWAYFSRSGRTLEIFTRPTNGDMRDTVKVKLTLRQFLRGVKFLNKK